MKRKNKTRILFLSGLILGSLLTYNFINIQNLAFIKYSRDLYFLFAGFIYGGLQVLILQYFGFTIKLVKTKRLRDLYFKLDIKGPK